MSSLITLSLRGIDSLSPHTVSCLSSINECDEISNKLTELQKLVKHRRLQLADRMADMVMPVGPPLVAPDGWLSRDYIMPKHCGSALDQYIAKFEVGPGRAVVSVTFESNNDDVILMELSSLGEVLWLVGSPCRTCWLSTSTTVVEAVEKLMEASGISTWLPIDVNSAEQKDRHEGALGGDTRNCDNHNEEEEKEEEDLGIQVPAENKEPGDCGGGSGGAPLMTSRETLTASSQLEPPYKVAKLSEMASLSSEARSAAQSHRDALLLHFLADVSAAVVLRLSDCGVVDDCLSEAGISGATIKRWILSKGKARWSNASGWLDEEGDFKWPS